MLNNKECAPIFICLTIRNMHLLFLCDNKEYAPLILMLDDKENVAPILMCLTIRNVPPILMYLSIRNVLLQLSHACQKGMCTSSYMLDNKDCAPAILM